MSTIPSYINRVHGVLAYQPAVLELDHPWDGPGPYRYPETWEKLPEDFYCELYDGHIVMQEYTRELQQGSVPYMATIPSFIKEIHGILAYEPEVLELDHPWDAPGPYTFSETWPKLPEDFYCELIEGHIVMSPAARELHQALSTILTELLAPIGRMVRGKTFAAPFDVMLDDQTVLQPDLIFLSPERRQLFRGMMRGAPDVCIEIMSPSRPQRDRQFKFNLYEKNSVPEYWLFDPQTQTVQFYLLVDNRYQLVEPAQGTYQSPRLPYLKLDLSLIWQRLEEAMSE